mmetsp:Transcript_41526/g.69220  ORF Transcript_41526/g.69220 Transcript_41526/m.69220 type:complete len:155 (-) Transcript_41526:131-595(-)
MVAVVGRSWYVCMYVGLQMLMPKDVARNHDQYLRNFFETGIKKVIGQGREITGQRADASTFAGSLSVSCPVEINGNQYFVGLLRDLSKIKLAEKRLTTNAKWIEHIVNGDTKDVVVDSEGQVHYKVTKSVFSGSHSEGSSVSAQSVSDINAAVA